MKHLEKLAGLKLEHVAPLYAAGMAGIGGVINYNKKKENTRKR